MRNLYKKLISRLQKSNDTKALASNFGYLMLLKIAGYIFPLLTIPYLARVIGVEGFGKIAIAVAIITWFQTVTDWGFSYTATRDVAQSRDNPERVSEIFSNVLWARILLMVLSLIFLLLAIANVAYLRENQAILLITFSLIPGHIFFSDWFFQAMERMKYITAFNLVSKIIFTAMVFIFIKEKSDFILHPLFISLGYAVSGIFSMYIIIVKWKFKIHPPRLLAVSETIKNSTDVFINNIAPNFYNSFSTVLVGYYGGSVSTGLLDAGRKFVSICQEFINVISIVFFPFLSRKGSNEHKVYSRVNLSIAFVSSVALYFSAPLLINIFFTPEFSPSILVLKIMCFFLFFHALINIYGVNYLIINGFERQFRNITILFSLIGFVCLFPVIYFYDYIGAAIVVTVVRGMIGVAVYREYRKKMPT